MKNGDSQKNSRGLLFPLLSPHTCPLLPCFCSTFAQSNSICECFLLFTLLQQPLHHSCHRHILNRLHPPSVSIIDCKISVRRNLYAGFVRCYFFQISIRTLFPYYLCHRLLHLFQPFTNTDQ